MNECVICKIIAGIIPSWIVYRDSQTICFLPKDVEAWINLLHASGTAAQQSVLHMHVHLIPRFDGDGLNAWPVFPEITLNKDELLERLQLAEQNDSADR